MSDTDDSAVNDNPATGISAGLTNEKPVVFQLTDVSKKWPGEDGFELSVPALKICRGEKVALVGYSGCGKSTLLDLLAMVLRPDDAKRFSFHGGQDKALNVAHAWRDKDLDLLAQARLHFIGYVLQTGGLLPFLSVYDNIALSRYSLGLPEEETVHALAQRLGIERHLQKNPAQLSVGERQRVAIARAMAHKPSVVIADEPTASLDPINAGEIMALFIQIAVDEGVTLIVATHEWERVKELGFRRITFNLNKDESGGIVKAKVSS